MSRYKNGINARWTLHPRSCIRNSAPNAHPAATTQSAKNVTDPGSNASYDPMRNTYCSVVGAPANTSKQTATKLPIEIAQVPIRVVGQKARCITYLSIPGGRQGVSLSGLCQQTITFCNEMTSQYRGAASGERRTRQAAAQQRKTHVFRHPSSASNNQPNPTVPRTHKTSAWSPWRRTAVPTTPTVANTANMSHPLATPSNAMTIQPNAATAPTRPTRVRGKSHLVLDVIGILHRYISG